MCYPVQCPRCNKVTWGGCGSHIAQALAGFSEEQLCHCDQQQAQPDPFAAFLRTAGR